MSAKFTLAPKELSTIKVKTKGSHLTFWCELCGMSQTVDPSELGSIVKIQKEFEKRHKKTKCKGKQ